MILEMAGIAGSLGAAYAAWVTRPTYRFKKTLERVIVANNIYDEERRQDGKRFRSYPQVKYVYDRWNGYVASVILPVNIRPSEFRKYKEIFEMVTNSEVDMEFEGSVCHMSFYQMPLHKVMNYNEQLTKEILKRKMSVVVGFSRRGYEIVDIADEAGAHMLISGATKMGKSILLRTIVTQLLLKYGHNINLSLLNNKITDNYPFMGIPNVEVEESLLGAKLSLEGAVNTIQVRKNRLFDKGYIDWDEWNHNETEKMFPYFIVIDEYARFSKDKEFEALVTEVVETGRYVGVHMIIATQRPDGREVISPRIKDNCLTKIALYIGTKGGSELMLGDPIAHNLPMIPGRAILYINNFRTMQVPFMSKEQCMELIGHLKEREKLYADTTGRRNLGELKEVRGNESRPHSEDALPGRSQTGGNHKSHHVKANKTKRSSGGSADKR